MPARASLSLDRGVGSAAPWASMVTGRPACPVWKGNAVRTRGCPRNC